MPTIGSGQKAALLEAYNAAVSLLPTSLRAEFLVIGGTSLVILGSGRKTEDVDFAVSGAALHAFEEASSTDPRFAKGVVADWTYTCKGKGIEDLKVALEFLQMGGAFAPKISAIKPAGGGFRASMGELLRMKGKTYLAREMTGDLDDFRFLLKKMEETGEEFEGVELEEEDVESMKETAAACGGRSSELLKKLLRKAGL